jgi:hypothetical protein
MDIPALLDALKHNYTLTELDLHNNAISSVGACQIAEYLSKKNLLESREHNQPHFHESSNNAHMYSPSNEDLWADALPKPKPRLHDSDNYKSGMFHLTKTNSSMGLSSLHDKHEPANKHVDSNTYHNNSNFAQDSNSFDHRLVDLDLGENNIGDVGATALARALQDNYTLTELSLDRNPIGLAGIRTLMQVSMWNGFCHVTLPVYNAVNVVTKEAFDKPKDFLKRN